MKKSICILTSLALIVCALFAVVGCGDKEDTRASRELDSNILNIWQGADGNVWVELENYEHGGFQFVSDSGQSATSIDFSLDGGKTWKHATAHRADGPASAGIHACAISRGARAIFCPSRRRCALRSWAWSRRARAS